MLTYYLVVCCHFNKSTKIILYTFYYSSDQNNKTDVFSLILNLLKFETTLVVHKKVIEKLKGRKQKLWNRTSMASSGVLRRTIINQNFGKGVVPYCLYLGNSIIKVRCAPFFFFFLKKV